MHDFKIVSQMVFICGTWFNVLLSASNFCFHFQAKIIYRGLQSSFVESLVMAKKKRNNKRTNFCHNPMLLYGKLMVFVEYNA